MNLQECMEHNHIFINWDGDSRTIIYMRRYDDNMTRIADAFINDNDYGTPGKEWLLEALRDCESWNAYPDTIHGFVQCCADLGCPVGESDFCGPNSTYEQKYKTGLTHTANW